MKRVSAALFVIVAALASSAHAQDADVARRAFEDGTALEKRGDYVGALAKFRESAEARPTPGNRFHVAYCLEMTGKIGQALKEYDEVATLAREQKKTEILTATQERAEGLRPRVPKIVLRVKLPPGGEALVDGMPIVSTEALAGAPIPVDPGPHVVTADAPEHETFKKSVDVAERATATVEIVLPKIYMANAAHSPVPAATTTTTTTTSAPPNHTAAIAATAGAVALIGAGVASFLVAGSAHDDAVSKCAALAAPTCDENRSKIRAFDALALTGWIAGAGLGAVAIWLWTSKPARVGVQGARLQLEGHF